MTLTKRCDLLKIRLAAVSTPEQAISVINEVMALDRPKIDENDRDALMAEMERRNAELPFMLPYVSEAARMNPHRVNPS